MGRSYGHANAQFINETSTEGTTCSRQRIDGTSSTTQTLTLSIFIPPHSDEGLSDMLHAFDDKQRINDSMIGVCRYRLFLIFYLHVFKVLRISTSYTYPPRAYVRIRTSILIPRYCMHCTLLRHASFFALIARYLYLVTIIVVTRTCLRWASCNVQIMYHYRFNNDSNLP